MFTLSFFYNYTCEKGKPNNDDNDYDEALSMIFMFISVLMFVFLTAWDEYNQLRIFAALSCGETY